MDQLATAARPRRTPLARRVPGRDLAIFLLLLALIDVSGLLHVYGLTALYSEELFYGLGILFVVLATLLIALPARVVFRWPRLHWGSLRMLSAALVGVGLVALAAQQLLLAIAHTARPVAGAPGAPEPSSLSGEQNLLLLALTAFVAVAITVAYARSEAERRRWLVLLSSVWFMYAVAALLFRLASGPVEIYNDFLTGPWPVSLLALALLSVLAMWRPLSPGVFMLVALVVGGALRLLAFSRVPIAVGPEIGDMLPLINLSTKRLLHFQSPYHLYQMPYDLPLTYWPLNLLPFLPFQALHLDLRWANLLLGPVVAGLLLLIRSGAQRGPGWACYAFGALYLTPTMFQWDLVTAAPPFWLWLSLMLAVFIWDAYSTPAQEANVWLRRVRTVLPGATLGAAFAAGPLALPFAPFILVWWLRRGWSYTARQLAMSGLVGAAAVLPFALWDLNAFWLGAVAWFNDLELLPRLQWAHDKSWLYEIGLSGQVWKAGLEGWLKPAQLVLLGVLAMTSRGRLRGPADVLRWGSAAYILFMVINPVIWPYLFTPALLGLIFTIAAREREYAYVVEAVDHEAVLPRQARQAPSVQELGDELELAPGLRFAWSAFGIDDPSKDGRTGSVGVSAGLPKSGAARLFWSFDLRNNTDRAFYLQFPRPAITARDSLGHDYVLSTTADEHWERIAPGDTSRLTIEAQSERLNSGATYVDLVIDHISSFNGPFTFRRYIVGAGRARK